MSFGSFEDEMERVVKEFNIKEGNAYIEHIGNELSLASVDVDKKDFEMVVTDVIERCDRKPRVRDFLKAIKEVNHTIRQSRNIVKDFGSFERYLDFCRWSNRKKMQSLGDELPHAECFSIEQYDREREEFLSACQDVAVLSDIKPDKSFFEYCFERGYTPEESVDRLVRAREEVGDVEGKIEKMGGVR